LVLISQKLIKHTYYAYTSLIRKFHMLSGVHKTFTVRWKELPIADKGRVGGFKCGHLNFFAKTLFSKINGVSAWTREEGSIFRDFEQTTFTERAPYIKKTTRFHFAAGGRLYSWTIPGWRSLGSPKLAIDRIPAESSICPASSGPCVRHKLDRSERLDAVCVSSIQETTPHRSHLYYSTLAPIDAETHPLGDARCRTSLRH